MPIKRTIVAISTLVSLVLCAGVLYFTIANQLRAERVEQFRNQLFCEALQPGMTPSEVREELTEFGNSNETPGKINDQLVLLVTFTSPDIVSLLGREIFVIFFEDLKYENTRFPVRSLENDYSQPICPWKMRDVISFRLTTQWSGPENRASLLKT